jgi:hypothetical protein
LEAIEQRLDDDYRRFGSDKSDRFNLGYGKRRYYRTFSPSYQPGKLDVDPLVEAVLVPYTPV